MTVRWNCSAIQNALAIFKLSSVKAVFIFQSIVFLIMRNIFWWPLWCSALYRTGIIIPTEFVGSILYLCIMHKVEISVCVISVIRSNNKSSLIYLQDFLSEFVCMCVYICIKFTRLSHICNIILHKVALPVYNIINT